jgi:putative ABC transport system substrate-binding protein
VIARRAVLLAGGTGGFLLVAAGHAEAQAGAKIPRIGMLWSTAIDDRNLTRLRSTFRERLAALGYVEGKSIVIEERSAEGDLQRLDKLARELVASQVAVIVAQAVTASLAARRATGTIPIVMVNAGDAVAAGLIASLARPGGNVTGTTNISFGSKQVELIHELVPRAARLAVLLNPSNANAPRYVADVEEAGRHLSLGVVFVEVRQAQDFATAFATIRAARPDGLLVMTEPLIGGHRDQVDRLRRRRPTGRDLRQRRHGPRRRPGLVRPGLCRALRPRRRLCRQDPEGRPAGEPAGRAADPIRADRQPEDGQDARAGDPAVGHRPRRRADPIRSTAG